MVGRAVITGRDMTTAKTPKHTQTTRKDNVATNKYQRLKSCLSADPKQLRQRRLKEFVPLTPIQDTSDEDEKRARVTRSISMVEAIAPQDGMEELLTMQMVALHQAAMACSSEALHPDVPAERKDANLAMMVKLTDAYAKHMAVLDKHRRRASQTVVVEHVNVESGGQAIVGHVETDTKKTKTS